MGVEVSKEEVEHILSNFARDKSPELDGWQTEFYLHFFDLMGEEIDLVVNESHCLGKVPDSLNSTFLVLIPKKDRPEIVSYFSLFLFVICCIILLQK